MSMIIRHCNEELLTSGESLLYSGGMVNERKTVEKIKTRAPKGRDGWRSISIPTPIYSKLMEISSERGESVSLIVRKWLSECLKSN